MKKEVVWEKKDVKEVKNRLEYYRYKMFLHDWFFDVKFEN
jgi:hypothetical protein